MSTILRSERLVLRPFSDQDLDLVHDLHTDPLVVKALYQGATPPLEDSRSRLAGFTADWRDHGFGFFAVHERKEDGDAGDFVGRSGLRYLPGATDLELGNVFYERASGLGYAPEAGRAVIRFALMTLCAPKVVGVVRPENARAARTTEKMGFRYIDDRMSHGRMMRYYEVSPESLRQAEADYQMAAATAR